MAQHGQRVLPHVGAGNAEPPLQQHMRLGGQQQILARPRAGAPVHPAVDEIQRPLAVGPRGAHQVQGVKRDVLADGHLAHELLQFEHARGSEHFAHGRGRLARGVKYNLPLVLRARVGQVNAKHEPVQLRFRQRVGPLLLDGVLRRQHHERAGQIVAGPRNGHPLFLHRFQQRRLRLGRRPVDFVRQQQIGKDWPPMKPEGPLARNGILLKYVRARDVRGHQVRGELDAAGVQVDRAAERSDHQRLGQARHSDEQAMPSREQGHQHLVQHLALSHHHFADLPQHPLVRFFEPRDGFLRLRARFRRSRLRFVQRESELNVSQRENGASFQRTRKHALSAHDNPVAAPGVFQLVAIVAAPRDDRVLRRDGIARNAQVVPGVPAYGGALFERKAVFLFLDFIDKCGHGKVSGSLRT